jgi:hypothetical protein
MKFMDLFRPDWKHSDFYVRLAAVKNITDQKALIEVASHESFKIAHWVY